MHLTEVQEFSNYLQVAAWHKSVYHFEIGTMTLINIRVKLKKVDIRAVLYHAT